MAQFTLFENQNAASKKTYPYFVDIQNSLLESLNTRLVIPLTPAENLGEKSISSLCPTTGLHDEEYVLLTHQMTNVPVSALKVPAGSLEHLRDDIVAAIDFLVTGV